MLNGRSPWKVKSRAVRFLRRRRVCHLSTGAHISPGRKEAQDGGAEMSIGAKVGMFVGGEGLEIE